MKSFLGGDQRPDLNFNLKIIDPCPAFLITDVITSTTGNLEEFIGQSRETKTLTAWTAKPVVCLPFTYKLVEKTSMNEFDTEIAKLNGLDLTIYLDTMGNEKRGTHFLIMQGFISGKLIEAVEFTLVLIPNCASN